MVLNTIEMKLESSEYRVIIVDGQLRLRRQEEEGGDRAKKWVLSCFDLGCPAGRRSLYRCSGTYFDNECTILSGVCG